ncbi:MAG: patatin-like phospholipase family protein, partial [Romboutsia sp.]|nr:patatin-like phospholipase family protein [Romboutsia sp.]
GALKYINKFYDISKIKRVIATSAGSIVGLMILLDFTLEEMFEFVMDHNFNEISEDDTILTNISRFSVNFGFFSSIVLENWIIKILSFKKIKLDIKFLEFQRLIKKDLILTCTCLNTNELKLMSAEETPDISIINAIKIAMSLPFVFEPVILDNIFYVDGALISNYPFEIVYKYDPDLKSTLGFNLYSDIHRENKIYGLIGYIDSIVKSITAHQNKKYSNTIMINTKDITTVDFNISDDQKYKLFGRGYRAARDYLKKNS